MGEEEKRWAVASSLFRQEQEQEQESATVD